jgi:RNA polymerase sigma factor (sigma-70 family)
MNLSEVMYGKCDRCVGNLEQPEHLCYYHQKIADGFIEEPEEERHWGDLQNDLERYEAQYLALAHTVCGRMLPKERHDEGMTEAGLIYHKVIREFDKNKKFKSYASQAIRNAVINMITKERREQDKMALLGDMIEVVLDSYDMEEDYDREEQKLILLNTLEDMVVDMNYLQQDIVTERMLGGDPMTLRELGRKHGVSKNTVQREETKIMDELKEIYHDDSI